MSNIRSYVVKPVKTKMDTSLNNSNLNADGKFNMSETVNFNTSIKENIEKLRNMSNQNEEKIEAKKLDEVKILEKENEILSDSNYKEFLTHDDRRLKQEQLNQELEKTREEIINDAKDYVGNSYVWGGTSLTDGIDCSGCTQAIYKKYGVDLPHSSKEQRNSGMKIEGLGNAKPGDLLCFKGHVALYAGNGEMVHAKNAKSGIVYEQIDAYWANRIVTIVRPNVMI